MKRLEFVKNQVYNSLSIQLFITNTNIDLSALGWNSFFENQLPAHKKAYTIGRVIIEEKNRYTLLTQTGQVPAIVSKKIVKQAVGPQDFPKVGDWVLFDRYNESSDAVIYVLLERKSKVSRKGVDPTPGAMSSEEQIMATNLDILFIVQSADQNFNLRRLDRYVAMSHAGGVTPVIILNKIDVNPEYENQVVQIKERFPNIEVLAISATDGTGIKIISDMVHFGVTASFVGSSGVGKSSIINALLGQNVIKTSEISEKLNKGRHTTTHRELLMLATGGLVIDTPGIRELSLWDAEEGLELTFADIAEIARGCRYRDCTHTQEEGCAILEALEDGQIDDDRYEQFVKLKQENQKFKKRRSDEPYAQKKEKFKKIAKFMKQRQREKDEYF